MQEALPLAHNLADQEAESELERIQGLLHIYGDKQIDPGIEHCGKSAELARQTGNQELLGLALSCLSHLYLAGGRIKEAEIVLLEQVKIFRRLDNRPKLQDALHGLAMIQLGTGDFAKTLEF